MVCFVLAAGTGLLFRFGLLRGLPLGLEPSHVRHAHSHLMYFGWVTPASMILLLGRIPSPSSRRARWLVDGALLLALLSYPLFLSFGYRPVPIGTAQIPLAAIGAAGNMFVWYGFAWRFTAVTRAGDPLLRSGTRTCWSAAIAFLVLSSLGAWGVGPAAILDGAGGLWYQVSLHLFLDLFAEGWLVLVVLGAAYQRFGAHLRPGRETVLARWGRRLLIAGLPVSFLFGVSPDLLATPWRIASRLGTGAAGIGLLLQTSVFLRVGARADSRPDLRYWGFPLALLSLKALAQTGAGLGGAEELVQQRGLRILYLHVLLLGGVTPGLLAAAADRWGPESVRGIHWLNASIGVLLFTLLPLTSLWPSPLTGGWVHDVAIFGASLPILAAIVLLMRTGDIEP